MSHFPQEIITVVGGCAAPLPARPAVGALGGGLPFLSPANPAFTFFPAPYPPSPLPLRGRGSPRLFHARGSAPCIPGLNPARRGKRGANHTPGRGACLSCRLSALTLVCFFAPIPPTPFPAGRGRLKVVFMQGAPPLASPGAEPGRHLHDHRFLLVYGGQCRQPRRGGDRGRWNYPSQATAAFEMVLSPGVGIASAAGGLPPAPLHLTACGTYSPCHAGAPGLNPRVAAKPIEPPFYWQCRQPRRGGTGGDGTIRRTRRRRLRWSSPPGQG